MIKAGTEETTKNSSLLLLHENPKRVLNRTAGSESQGSIPLIPPPTEKEKDNISTIPQNPAPNCALHEPYHIYFDIKA